MTAYREYEIALANAEKINEIFYEMSDDEADDFIEYSGLVILPCNKKEYQKGYNGLRRFMKKYGWTLKMIKDWGDTLTK